MAVKTTVQAFGEFEGKVVNQYHILQDPGIQVSVINYGATVTSIMVPDKKGSLGDIVLGFDTLDGYINSGHFYIGGICGRYANRIAGGKLNIHGLEYQLSNNIDMGCLHGGYKGFDKKYWDAEILPEENGVVFTYYSRDREEGFPGNLKVIVTYRVINSSLEIEYIATTDKASPVNLTNHSYFNLSGGTETNILDHTLQINANRIVETGDGYFPTGKLTSIENAELDFTRPRQIGNEKGEGHAYDYSWVLDKQPGELAEAATLLHEKSGRHMTVFTTQPAIHFYSGHLLNGQMQDTKKGKEYGPYAGLCLETQHFPDSPNHPLFPNTILMPGGIYREKTIFRFGT